MSFAQGQDWSTAGWSSKGPATGANKQQALNKARRTGEVITEAKYNAGGNKSAHSAANVNMRKLEEDVDSFKHAAVDRSLSQALMKARADKKMTQKALATAINEKPQIIAEYESGKAIPNGQIIGKLERALGVKLPRGPKKKKTAEYDDTPVLSLPAFAQWALGASWRRETPLVEALFKSATVCGRHAERNGWKKRTIAEKKARRANYTPRLRVRFSSLAALKLFQKPSDPMASAQQSLFQTPALARTSAAAASTASGARLQDSKESHKTRGSSRSALETLLMAVEASSAAVCSNDDKRRLAKLVTAARRERAQQDRLADVLQSVRAQIETLKTSYRDDKHVLQVLALIDLGDSGCEPQHNDDDEEQKPDRLKRELQSAHEQQDAEDNANGDDSNQTEDDCAQQEDEGQDDENDDEAFGWQQRKSLEEDRPTYLQASVESKAHGPAASLSLTVAEPVKRGVQVPRPPRGGSGAGSGGKPTTSTTSRLKFQFPEDELQDWTDDGEEQDEHKATATRASPALLLRNKTQQRRRFTASVVTSNATASVSLRRKSFTMKRSPHKSASIQAAFPETNGLPLEHRWAMRRRSTSAISRVGSKSPSSWRPSGRDPFAAAAAAATSSANIAAALVPASGSTSCSQMVLRVRKADGKPEIVISKQSAPRFVVWQWSDRRVRMPLAMALGPQQHGLMLRQLRYVKSVMHHFPWAKTQLRGLLASYTKKDMSKEELYPQLSTLNHQVEQEMASKQHKQKALTSKKNHLSLQLSIATSALNELQVTKFGRRGRPHETKLSYDPRDPMRLCWFRKNGDKSDEWLALDDLRILDGSESELLRKASRKHADCCVMLVTSTRSLDLQLKSAMHRDWLVNALKDVVAFALQYKAAGAAAASRGKSS